MKIHILFVLMIGVFLFVSLFLSSCANSDAVSGGGRAYSFAGNWQGSGVDSEGNEFAFAAKVIALGGRKFRMLVLDKLDTKKKPLHVMDGVLEDNKFTYTADEGEYIGGGKLGEEAFEGYYKGPVDGSYKMHRVR
jgi:hypothetical protein